MELVNNRITPNAQNTNNHSTGTSSLKTTSSKSVQHIHDQIAVGSLGKAKWNVAFFVNPFILKC